MVFIERSVQLLLIYLDCWFITLVLDLQDSKLLIFIGVKNVLPRKSKTEIR